MKRSRHNSSHERLNSRSRAESRHPARRGTPELSGSFTCIHCGASVAIDPLVAGVLNRNHCPYCLWSRHVDLYEAGDRLCACKGPMRPVGLTLKETRKKYARENSGELMLIHACSECEAVSINRIAADDAAEEIIAIFNLSLALDEEARARLAGQPIRVLAEPERWLVEERLYGRGGIPGESAD